MSKNKDKHHSHNGAEKDLPSFAGHAPAPGEGMTDTGRQTKDDSQRATEKEGGKTNSERQPPASPASAPATETGGPAEKIAQLNDRLLRLQADFDNFRKRTLREKNELFDSANQALMLEILPVLDHLHLGIQAASTHKTDPAFREGLILILDQLMGVLSKFGLSPIAAENQVFDAHRFESVNALPSATEPEGTVLALVRRGYMLRNKLLRPAQVIVSSGPPEPAEKANAGRPTTDAGQEKTQA